MSASAWQEMGVNTEIGHANADRIVLRGRDLVDDLMGGCSYTEALLLAVTATHPSKAATQAVDAVLVSLIDHGMQPSALAARVTYSAAPDAIQGALAAGLLGAGSSLLGSMEQAGRLLHDISQAIIQGAAPTDAVDRALDAQEAQGKRVPGFGHALHREGDPRGERLLSIGEELGVALEQIALLRLVGERHEARTGRRLAPNATGAAAALLLGVGIPWRLHRGVAMVSRAAGLLAHIGEEAESPVTPAVRQLLRGASWLDEEDDDD